MGNRLHSLPAYARREIHGVLEIRSGDMSDVETRAGRNGVGEFLDALRLRNGCLDRVIPDETLH
jgi:hypothetical protein